MRQSGCNHNMRQPVILRNRLEIGVLEADGRGGMSQERPQPPDLPVAFYSLLHCRLARVAMPVVLLICLFS
ncbi:hypothetical protein AMC90_CH01939 [Rhizobium phaseoli]|nr:hypothetical protein AMC90_CH01939 [Rhizobium phaseoli]KKZ89448.1 hypothetical protein RPHASCH2410_CH02290 [Rhizobium phaseoli Ch24-10]